VEFNRKSREFLSSLGIDFNGIEGCMENNIFHTRIGVFLEHVLGMLQLRSIPVTFKSGVK
ncbi:hypothetical protein BgiMline_017511, partial [Biomphalaria glabrata]